ncbi:DUF4446 family protein [Paenibacillus sp. SYP-B3998]|uniref:DUF4446 family protein n=1 Tax=Paenibacillus sp. SYP-B3998 TaxID=2678564 RepID=A0A6G4A0V4_9BACL|nr:DUF4446 family protein [Paenibacillus sp. SYP-B3998]NEW07277.1 DUF4446 family protein [Paenibacillus sp. SYP-B3998]
MEELLGLNGDLILLACMALIVISFVLIILLWSKLSKLRKQYMQMMNGSQAEDIEQLLINIQGALNDQKAESAATSAKVHAIREAMTKMKSKVGIHRYNAFAEGGSDMSFTIAILDEHQDGVVMTGIHSREQTYIYAKPVQKAQSTYTLSPEEKEAINQTSKQQ